MCDKCGSWIVPCQVAMDDLFQLRSQHPTAFSQLSLENVFRFSLLASKLKNEILLAQPPSHPISESPAFLPPSVTRFLSRCCDTSEIAVNKCWEILGPTVWQSNWDLLGGCTEQLEETFWVHGRDLGFSSARTIFPPSHLCSNSDCTSVIRGRKLQKAEQRAIVLFTLDHGPLPTWSVHLSCKACNINYHHNFRVKEGQRIYYDNIPDIIQVGEHQFVEKRVIEMWRTNMNIAWFVFV